MAASFRERLIERVRGWPVLTWPAIVAAVGLVATLAGTYMMEQGRQARESLRFDAIVDQANEAVANRLDTYMAVLRAGAGLFAASEDVSAADYYGAGYQDVQNRVPKIDNTRAELQWSPKVSMAQALRRIFDAYRTLGSEARSLVE